MAAVLARTLVLMLCVSMPCSEALLPLQAGPRVGTRGSTNTPTLPLNGHASQDTVVMRVTDSPLEERIPYSICRVNSRERALDVLVFRHGRLVTSVEEYLTKNPNQTIDGALHFLTSTYDEQGQSLEFSGGDEAGELVQFFAVVQNSTICNNGLDQAFLSRTHGVIGSIDAFKSMRSCTGEMDQDAIIELKNLRVHDSCRRQGIGRALVEAVQQYAQQVKEHGEQGKAMVYLQFDSNNVGAIRIYEDAGFFIDGEDTNRMIWFA